MKRTEAFDGSRVGFTLILLASIAGNLFASPFADSLIVTNPDSLTQKSSYLSFSLSYGNNSSFLGRYQARTMPFVGADVTYLHKSGLWLSCLGYDITGSSPFLDEVDLMAGYSIDISSRWDASAYYGRYFFQEETELVKASVANSASLSVGFDWSILYSRLSSTYIFGNDVNDVFLILDHSRYFEFPKFLGSAGDLSIDPQISLIAGTQTFYEQYLISEEVPIPGRPANPGKSNGKGKGKGNGNGNTNGNGGTTTETTVVENESRSFNLMSYEFTVPVVYSRGNWAFETNGRYSIPVNAVAGYLTKPQFFLTSSIFYTIGSKN